MLLDNETRSKDVERVRVRDLRARVQAQRARLRSIGRKVGLEPLAAIQNRLGAFWKTEEIDKIEGSERRRIATMRVAQSFSDWAEASEVRGPHLSEAMKITVSTFQKLRKWDL